MKKITDTNKFIYKERMNGITLQEIADKLNSQYIQYVNRQGKSSQWTTSRVDTAIRRYMGDEEFKSMQKEQKLTRERNRKSVYELYYNKNKTFQEISDILGINIRLVYEYMKIFREENKLPNKKKLLHEKITALVVELRNKGLMFSEIAVKLNKMGYVTFNKRQPWSEGNVQTIYITHLNKI